MAISLCSTRQDPHGAGVQIHSGMRAFFCYLQYCVLVLSFSLWNLSFCAPLAAVTVQPSILSILCLVRVYNQKYWEMYLCATSNFHKLVDPDLVDGDELHHNLVADAVLLSTDADN